MSERGMTYAGVGVRYDEMDPFKRMAQLAGRETAGNIARFGFSEVEWSRGESCYLVETPWACLGFVVEGLGTKNLVADAMYQLAVEMESLTGRTYYDHVAQCNAAMAFNDLITLGVLPVSYSQYLAVGESSWFNDEARCRELIEGTKKACMLARCTWGGGETPTLRGIVVPGTADLAGATFGIAPKGRIIRPDRIRHGDAIVIIASSGIHANGLTLAREIAAKLPDGYMTQLSDGRAYGEALLDPTYIYVPVVEDCQKHGVDIHYIVNVTGHGWRKLMRATQPFTYVVDTLPKQLPIFDFIQKHGPVDDEEAYGNLNMGAGFVLYVPEADVNKVLEVEKDAVVAGHIENSDAKKIVIKPVKTAEFPDGLEFAGTTLGVR